MHVVYVALAKDHRQRSTEESRLFMRMDHVVMVPEQHPEGFEDQQHIQEYLGPRRANAHVLDKADIANTQDAYIREENILPKMVSQQIHLVPQSRKSFDPLVDADGRTSGLKKRFWRDHQYFHLIPPLKSRLRPSDRLISRLISIQVSFRLVRIPALDNSYGYVANFEPRAYHCLRAAPEQYYSKYHFIK